MLVYLREALILESGLGFLRGLGEHFRAFGFFFFFLAVVLGSPATTRASFGIGTARWQRAGPCSGSVPPFPSAREGPRGNTPCSEQILPSSSPSLPRRGWEQAAAGARGLSRRRDGHPGFEQPIFVWSVP